MKKNGIHVVKLTFVNKKFQLILYVVHVNIIVNNLKKLLRVKTVLMRVKNIRLIKKQKHMCVQSVKLVNLLNNHSTVVTVASH